MTSPGRSFWRVSWKLLGVKNEARGSLSGPAVDFSSTGLPNSWIYSRICLIYDFVFSLVGFTRNLSLEILFLFFPVG